MTWTRIEASAVAAGLTAGLTAAIGDPLWMLARQWQVGEFDAEDAASPVLLRVAVSHAVLGEMRVGPGPPERLAADGDPLSARVEGEDVAGGPAGVRLAAEWARQLLRHAEAAGADAGLADRLRQGYPLVLPPDDGTDPAGRAELELLAARGFDARAVAGALRAGDQVDAALAPVAAPWLAELDGYTVTPPPARPPAWVAERMEYRASVAAPDFAHGLRLDAAGHPGGPLDWDAFDVAGGDTSHPLGPVTALTTVPVPLRYPGMPARRFWEFEDGAVSWGDVEGGPQDLPRFLVAQFVTVGADDWYLAPMTLPRGVIARVEAVQVLDSAGRQVTVPAAAALDHARYGPRRAWRFFELTGDPGPAAGRAPWLVLPAVEPPHDTGVPVEEVLFLRDEMANLGWALERVIEAASGRRLHRDREPLPEPDTATTPGAWRYDLATPVPANAVPLVPVRLDDEDAAIRLQRGRMAVAGGTSGARGLILEPSRRLLLHESELPGSGLRVTRRYEWCRGADGRGYLWQGRNKRPGAGIPAPGLANDLISPPPLPPEGPP